MNTMGACPMWMLSQVSIPNDERRTISLGANRAM
jgi:hypothetical protein